MEKIGFIGLGKMGSQLSSRLLKAGYSMTIYNRTKEKAAPLIDLGMQWVDSPKKVIQLCSIVFMSLTDNQAVSEIVEGKDGLLSGATSGKLVIDMSTISPEMSQQLAAKFRENHGQMLDAPISGNPVAVKNGTATIMVGGDATAFLKAKPILESITPEVFYVGENGHALFLKLAININLAAQFSAFSESVLLIQKAGLNIQNALEIMKHSAIASPGIQQRAPLILSPPSEPLFTIKMMQKDLLLSLDHGRKLGIPLLNTALTNEILTSATGLDYGEKDLSQLFQAMVEMTKKA